MLVSRVVRTEKGKSYLEVDGKPFLYQVVQSWYPPENDFTKYIQGTADLEYPVFSFWLYWRQIEPKQGKFDFSAVDQVIDLAVKHNLRLDVLWSGSMFCDHMDYRWAPEWVFNNDKFKLRDKDGNLVVANGYDMGPCPAADPLSEGLFEAEKAATIALLDHLEQYDTTHRIIMFQVENEINLQGYFGGKKNVLAYIDRLAKVFHEHPHRVAVRCNLAGFAMDPDVDAMEYVEAQGLDLYTMDIGIVRSVLADPNCTKMRHVAENSAYCNSSALIIAALASGGFYNVYRLDYDVYYKKPGFLDENWRLVPAAVKVKQLNQAMNRIPEVIATASPEEMRDFNNETNHQPFYQYSMHKPLGDYAIGMATRESDAVGLVIRRGDEYFCIADGDATFFVLHHQMECEAGSFRNGEWIKEEDVPVTVENVGWSAKNSSVTYKAGQALRIRVGGLLPRFDIKEEE